MEIIKLCKLKYIFYYAIPKSNIIFIKKNITFLIMKAFEKLKQLDFSSSASF